ncbi:15091_t:CDS:2 [Cetraspora pellucida]|uniref:15091_t:CDS:1 n=1 Tax=Cetraspora pellucida TaxID=1433469 RepID=A0A9N9JHV2_9GLOM|nr:15091_t:CDS:2 [Cetraspora pellucida]
MEETLDDTQIVETVLAEQLECKQGDPKDSDEKPPKISASEGLNGLKTFISFAEQMNNDFFFNNNDIKENQAINDECLDDNFSGSGNNDFSDHGNDDEFYDIYSSDSLSDYNSLPDYDFPDYDNYNGSSDNYEN